MTALGLSLPAAKRLSVRARHAVLDSPASIWSQKVPPC
jgi:hypothetical protein